MSTHRVAVNLLWSVPGVGGSEEYLVRQLLGLVSVAHDYDVHVYAPRGFSGRQPMVAASFPVHEAPSACTRRAVRIALEHTWLAWKTRGFHLVHHGGGSIPRIGSRRTLLTIHDVQWIEYPDYVAPIKLRYLRAMVPSSIRRALRIAVPSHFVADTLVRAFGVNPGIIGVVRHGLDEAFDIESTGADALRRSLHLGAGPVLVYPAMTHPHKNHVFLLQLLAMPSGPWADPALRLVFAGSPGANDARVRAMAADLGVADRVVMPGRVSNADRNGLLALAEAMVFPSEYEGFGAPIIEAMRFGTPVICSDRGSVPEVAGEAALVCALEAHAWVQALDEVRNRRDELVALGHDRAMQFTAEISATELIDQYDIAVAASRGRS